MQAKWASSCLWIHQQEWCQRPSKCRSRNGRIGWGPRHAQQSGATVVQSNIVIPPVQLFGHLDGTIPAAPSHILLQINQALRNAAHQINIHLLDLDALASRTGKSAWCAPALWHHAKQDIPLFFAPLFGDYVGRILGSNPRIVPQMPGCGCGWDLLGRRDRGRWTGKHRDWPGNGGGGSLLAFQVYLKQLYKRERGVILALCSKNDEKNALLPFDEHPDMALRRDDFAVIVANWQDKASNIKQIASQLNIGLDSLVFFR